MSGKKSPPVTIAESGAGGAPTIVTPVVDITAKLPAFWLTRDRIGDVLMECDVWAVQPDRVKFDDGDVMWLEPGVAAEVRAAIAATTDAADATYEQVWERVVPSLRVDTTDTCVDAWTVAEAKHRVGPGTPDNDRECLRVGREPAPIDRALLS